MYQKDTIMSLMLKELEYVIKQLDSYFTGISCNSINYKDANIKITRAKVLLGNLYTQQKREWPILAKFVTQIKKFEKLNLESNNGQHEELSGDDMDWQIDMMTGIEYEAYIELEYKC